MFVSVLLIMSQKKKVFVGLSGGVDSSVAALRLKEQGYLIPHVVEYFLYLGGDLDGVGVGLLDHVEAEARLPVGA